MEQLTQQIAIHEGFSSSLYKDSLGFYTIGYGFCVSDGIDQELAQLILNYQIQQATNELMNQPFYIGLDSVRQGVLIEFVFNIGLDGLLSFKNMIQSIMNKDWITAVADARNSKWANQVGEIRVNDMCSRLLTGQYAS